MKTRVALRFARWVLTGFAATLSLARAPLLANAQNLTDAQLEIISQRLAEGAQKSWELGTRSQTILELSGTRYSAFSPHALPPPQNPPGNLTTVLQPFFTIARNVVANRPNVNNNTVGPQPLMTDGSAADPASNGMGVLLAYWTEQATGNGDGGGLDYAGAAKDQLDFLLTRVLRTPDGALSHRVAEVQIWSDFVYMVPPFLAYYGVMSQNRTLLLEAYNQIKLYHNYLSDPGAQHRWKHVLLGPTNNDEGYWATGNGWAAAGMLRVLATIRNSQYANTLKNQQKDLANWVKEVHDGMYALLDPSVNLFTNYPDVPVSPPDNFYDGSSSALLASTVFRGAIMLNLFTHVPAAEKIRRTLFSPSNDTSSNSNSSSVFQNYPHITSDGWLTPVVNPNSYGRQGEKSPEGQAFVLQLHSAWRDWVEDGARGANGASSWRLGWGRGGSSSAIVWTGVVCGLVVGILV